MNILLIGLVLYEAFTIGCIFADNINTLIALRTIEGFIVGSSIVTVQAIIADVFPEEELGQAMGAFLVRSCNCGFVILLFAASFWALFCACMGETCVTYLLTYGCSIGLTCPTDCSYHFSPLFFFRRPC